MIRRQPHSFSSLRQGHNQVRPWSMDFILTVIRTHWGALSKGNNLSLQGRVFIYVLRSSPWNAGHGVDCECQEWQPRDELDRCFCSDPGESSGDVRSGRILNILEGRALKTG